jgi:hypothetical protein
MSQFYMNQDDKDGRQRCQESLKLQRSITISGVPAMGGVAKFYTGIVQGIESDPKRGPGRELRITIRE